ncbi:hypothetical protein JCM11251_002981 [Rhodosporidiobolus azoricus]
MSNSSDEPPCITLFQPQQDLIALLTPFRFHDVPLPSSQSISASHCAHTTATTTISSPTFLEPYLPLSLPPLSPFPLILTPTRSAPDFPPRLFTLNHPKVAFSLVGPPYPYTEELARDFSEGKKRGTEEYFGKLGGLAQKALDAAAGSVEVASKRVLEEGEGKIPDEWLPDGLPFSDLRNQETGDWVGDLSTMRWNFEDVADQEERERLRKDNLARKPGDPELAWSFGFFLSPNYHGQGLMHLALSSMFDAFLRSFLRCERIHGAAMAHNVASIRTQEKNGLVRYNTWTREVAETRGGGTVDVAVLRWEKKPEASA